MCHRPAPHELELPEEGSLVSEHCAGRLVGRLQASSGPSLLHPVTSPLYHTGIRDKMCLGPKDLIWHISKVPNSVLVLQFCISMNSMGAWPHSSCHQALRGGGRGGPWEVENDPWFPVGTAALEYLSRMGRVLVLELKTGSLGWRSTFESKEEVNGNGSHGRS